MNITINVWGNFEGNSFSLISWRGTGMESRSAMRVCQSFVAVFWTKTQLISTKTVCWLRMFCMNLRQKTQQKRINPAPPIWTEEVLRRWRLWRSKSNALKCFLLSSLPFGVLPLSFPAALSSPPPHPSLTPSLWMSCPRITGACGGLSETCVQGWRRPMGSPSSSGSPPPHPKLVGKESSQWVLRRKLIGFLQDILFHWMYKQEKTSHPKP